MNKLLKCRVFRLLQFHTQQGSDTVSVDLHLRDGRTDRRRESNLEHLSLKMWHLVKIILMNFLIINWPNFVYLLV